MTARKDSAVRILVADDNEAVRNSLCSVLRSQEGWTVCGEARDGHDAVEQAFQLRPDVILVDVSMPCLNGFETAALIHEQIPDVEILIVTQHDPRTLAHIAPRPGVRGYVAKSRIAHDLIPAVEAASKHQPLASSTAA